MPSTATRHLFHLKTRVVFNIWLDFYPCLTYCLIFLIITQSYSCGLTSDWEVNVLSSEPSHHPWFHSYSVLERFKVGFQHEPVGTLARLALDATLMLWSNWDLSRSSHPLQPPSHSRIPSSSSSSHFPCLSSPLRLALFSPPLYPNCVARHKLHKKRSKLV